jgi:hypothetical protein
MEYLQLIVAMLALYLFMLFLAQPFLIAWRLLFDGWSDSTVYDPGPELEDPNSVDPIPVLELSDILSAAWDDKAVFKLGRDRFGRMVYKILERNGRVGFYYWDKETHERDRIAARRRQETASSQVDEPRLSLGWKGFTADSSPWEILGVARDASIAQIKAAYRKLITNYHPDRFSNLTAIEVEQLERDSKLINAAYAKLMKS